MDSVLVMLVLVLFVAFFVGLVLLPITVAFEVVWIYTARLQKTVRCGSCRYDLRGLDAPGRCPECGESFDEFFAINRPPKTRLRLIAGRRVFVATCLAMFLSHLCLWSAMAESIGAVSYMADGYTREVAQKAARVRGDGQNAAAAIAVFLWVSPSLTYAGRRARWVLLFAGLITLTIAGAHGYEIPLLGW